MLLQIRNSPPHDLFVSILIVASMRKLAEVNEVLEHFVHVLEEWSSDATVGTIYAWLLVFFGRDI